MCESLNVEVCSCKAIFSSSLLSYCFSGKTNGNVIQRRGLKKSNLIENRALAFGQTFIYSALCEIFWGVGHSCMDWC